MSTSPAEDPFKIIISEFNFGKFFYYFKFGLPDNCIRKRVHYSKEFLSIGMTPVYRELSLVTGLWVHLSIIAIFNLFCALVSIASLLAEELDKRTKEKAFPTDRKALSFAIENWFIEFDRLYVMVERINKCFGPIVALAVAYYFVQFPSIVQNVLMEGFFPDYSSYLCKTLIFIRLCTIITVCNQLETKVTAVFK